MSEPSAKLVASRVAAAERAVTEHLDRACRLEADAFLAGSSERSRLLRCRVVEPLDIGPHVILKWARSKVDLRWDPEIAGGLAEPVFDEWACLAFLDAAMGEASPAPRFLGGDRRVGLLVMGDLGSGPSLADHLLGPSADDAETAALAYFATLGRLHAATAGCRVAFDAARDALGPRTAPPSAAEASERWLAGLTTLTRQLDKVVAPAVAEDIRELAEAWARPTIEVLSPVDTCPDNSLQVGDRLHLLDFEGGRAWHAFSDVVRARLPFPTCWCVGRFPVDLVPRLEHAYRGAFDAGSDAAMRSDPWRRGLAEGCAGWALRVFTAFGDLSTDRAWGQASRHQRVHDAAHALASTLDEFDAFAALGALAHDLADALDARWPTLPRLGLYPAWRDSVDPSGRLGALDPAR